MPHVSAAFPKPDATDPKITWIRSDAIGFLLVRWWRNIGYRHVVVYNTSTGPGLVDTSCK
jgi:hypothetical protein